MLERTFTSKTSTERQPSWTSLKTVIGSLTDSLPRPPLTTCNVTTQPLMLSLGGCQEACWR